MSTDLSGKLTDVSSIMMPATIQIFLKGLKSMHTIATKVYEKGPQTLSEAIKEVEKLQAAQTNNFITFTHVISQHHVK